MDGLIAAFGPIFTILLVIAGILLVLTVAVELNYRRLKRRAEVEVGDRYDLQAALLDAVKDASANRHTLVDIRPFWRNRGVKLSHRKAIVDPLVGSREVTVHRESAGAGDFWDSLMEWRDRALYLPPSHLILTDRTWERMVHDGINGQTIVIERVGVMNWQSQNSGGGDIIGSPQTSSGRDSDVRTGSTEKGGPEGISSEQLAKLVAALREDARDVMEGVDRANLRALANKIEDEADQDTPDEDKIEGMLQRARRYVSEMGGIMRATGALLRAWNGLGNPGGEQ